MKMKLYYAFVDLDEAFDRVGREVLRWALRKLGVDEWLLSWMLSPVMLEVGLPSEFVYVENVYI